jgi:hypothetical protein
MREAFERVAARFPDAPPVTSNDLGGLEAAWSNGDIAAGLRSHGKEVVVFLAEAEAQVTSISMAVEILRGIFEDRLVAVAAFKDKALIRCYVAPAGDIGAGLNSPTHVYMGPIATAADEIRIRSWSGARDAG